MALILNYQEYCHKEFLAGHGHPYIDDLIDGVVKWIYDILRKDLFEVTP
jgi:hypothetical protein